MVPETLGSAAQYHYHPWLQVRPASNDSLYNSHRNPSQDLGARFGDQDGVFEVGGELPSTVTAVQSSSRLHLSVPAFTMGSTASTIPARSFIPCPGLPYLEPGAVREACCQSVAHEVADHGVTLGFDVGLHRMANVTQSVAHHR